MTVKGRVALVTGSTSGIGLGIARALAAEGADIMMNGFGDAAQITALQSDIATKGGVRVRYHGADVSKPADCAAILSRSFSSPRSGARATPVRFMWLHTNSSGFSSGA